MADELRVYRGGCHCGAVRFECDAPPEPSVHRCSCSICNLTDYLHLIVPASRFRLLEGRELLTEYRFNTGVARHFFCSRCGIKSFYVPRSNPDGVSVNYRCLDDGDPAAIHIDEFDGQNWEAGAHRLRDLSRE